MSYIVDVENGIAVKKSEGLKRFIRNETEKRRRTDLKETFDRLKECIPSLHSTSSASKAVIIKKAIEFINTTNKKNEVRKGFIMKLRRQNTLIARQIKQLESKKSMVFVEKTSPYSDESQCEESSAEEIMEEETIIDVC